MSNDQLWSLIKEINERAAAKRNGVKREAGIIKSPFEIGQAVTRIDDRQYYGNRGTVVEIDAATGRTRVKWSDKRTWVKPSCLTASENLTDEMIAANRKQMEKNYKPRYR
jgi:hypothetical protein